MIARGRTLEQLWLDDAMRVAIGSAIGLGAVCWCTTQLVSVARYLELENAAFSFTLYVVAMIIACLCARRTRLHAIIGTGCVYLFVAGLDLAFTIAFIVDGRIGELNPMAASIIAIGGAALLVPFKVGTTALPAITLIFFPTAPRILLLASWALFASVGLALAWHGAISTL